MATITRKRMSKLTTAEKRRYVDGVTRLIEDGTYGRLVAIHGDMGHNMHSMNAVGRQRFLPWHRVFLLRLEESLRAIDARAFVPYWDWVKQRSIPAWLDDFQPRVNVPGQGNVQVERNTGPHPTLPSKARIQQVLAEPTYTKFTSALESAHNDVHMWVGGTMSQIEVSPADPIFWMHHANVDRLWSQWQAGHAGKNPSLSGANATMDPWGEREPQVRSISALGYAYGP